MNTKTLNTVFLIFASTLFSAHAGGNAPVFKETRITNVAYVANIGLNVGTSNGSITIERSGTDKIQIVALLKSRSQERLNATKIIAKRTESGMLNIYARWPDSKRKRWEDCSFKIKLPDAQGVNLTTSNGKIYCKGLAGKASLKTSNGKIEVISHRGPVNARTSNGAIMARQISGRMNLKTSNGAIRAIHVTSPIHAQTSNGAITIELGAKFSGKIKASTGNGALNIANIPQMKRISSSKKRIHFSVGTAKHESFATTSNGAITIRTLQPKN